MISIFSTVVICRNLHLHGNDIAVGLVTSDVVVVVLRLTNWTKIVTSYHKGGKVCDQMSRGDLQLVIKVLPYIWICRPLNLV